MLRARARATRRLVALAAAVVAAALMAVPPAEAVSTAAPDWSPLEGCVHAVNFTVELTPGGGFTAHDPLYGYTFDQGFMTAAVWQTPTSTDAVRNLEGYGLMWLHSTLRAIRDRDPGGSRLSWLVDRAATSLSWRPDSGQRTDVVWSEGVNLRREQSLNCLYSITHDPRLVPVLSAVAQANMDPDRYYGPPRFPPHNHGLMANLALLDTARLLGRSDWRSCALQRMRTAIDATFTAGGMTIEQSVSYGWSLLLKWADAADDLRSMGGADAAALAAHIDAEVARARAAYNFVVQPDGMPVPIGDQRAPHSALVPQRTTALVDGEAGMLASRWSWTSPDDWYAVRFGRPTAMHGHQDRMSVVWWSTGRPVLVDPATATYTAGPARTWSLSPAAHNVPVVAGGSYAPWVTVTLDGYAHRAAADTVLLSGSLYRVHQHRRLTVDPVHDRLTVLDTASRPVNQVWQLDPRWRFRCFNSARTAALFTDPTGGRLLVTTTGRIASVLKGAPGLAGGWVFSYPPAARTAAARMVVGGSTSTTTTFTVTGAPLAPWAS